MKAVILAGGLGTRLAEETSVRPKPMVEVGGKPVIWHIMKTFSYYGIDDFIICLGYKGYMVKEYFANYFLHTSDVTLDLKKNSMELHHGTTESWKVTLVDTGDATMTGGRLKRVAKYINEDTFFFTYGDGVSNVNISDLLSFHLSHKCLATLTAVQPPGRFGSIRLDESFVTRFEEKPSGDNAWINAGYFALSSGVLDYIDDDSCVWEREPLEMLAKERQMHAFQHDGFWMPMDTLRDKQKLEELWASGKAPWKVWT